MPGQLDFSTATVRGGCIVHNGVVLSRADIGEILRRHHADNGENKALMVFTTAVPESGKRAFPLHPIFHLAQDGTITPWNRRARILTPRTPPQQQSRRRVVWWTLLTLLVIALMVAAVMTVAGAASDPIRAVGIAVLVVCALAILGAVGAVLEAQRLRESVDTERSSRPAMWTSWVRVPRNS